jgi:hypothetical protein
MALRDMSEGKLILITVGVAVLFAIPCWGYFYFVYRDYAAATDRFQAAQKLNGELETQKVDMTKKASRITAATESFEMVKRMLPEKDDVPNFFAKDLPNLLAKNEFEMLSLTIKPKAEKEKLKDPNVNVAVWYREFEMRIAGTYKNMIQLLKEIEEGREALGEAGDLGTYRLYKVKEFEFSPSSDKTLEPNLKHTAKIVLDVYYIDEKAK